MEKSRSAWKQEQRTRQLHQALLRGSSVVMVSVLVPAGPQPPQPSLDVSAPAGTHPPLHPPLAGKPTSDDMCLLPGSETACTEVYSSPAFTAGCIWDEMRTWD